MGRAKKTPLILIHGFPLDSSMWAGQKRHFRDRWPLLCPDLPGFGKSRKKAPDTIVEYALSIRERLKEDKIGKAVIAGFSMGGYIALSLYEICPEIFGALILIDTRSAGDSALARAGRNVALKSLESEGMKFFADNMPQKLLSEDGLKNGKLVSRVRRMILKQRPEAVRNALIAMKNRKSRTHVLKRIAVPTLFVCGENDVITPPGEMISMANRTGGCSFSLVKGAGHLANLENPAGFNAALEEFLDAL